MNKFRPSVVVNTRVPLRPEDLDNHPLAQTYIDYLNIVRYPVDFHVWLKRRQDAEIVKAAKQKLLLAAAMAEPFCKSPSKKRRF